MTDPPDRQREGPHIYKTANDTKKKCGLGPLMWRMTVGNNVTLFSPDRELGSVKVVDGHQHTSGLSREAEEWPLLGDAAKQRDRIFVSDKDLYSVMIGCSSVQ
jgi:hypothetical protein